MSKGYCICDYEGTGMLEITKNDDTNVFETDEQAVEQAVKDGIKIIPVEELPEQFDRRYFGWIDTPENRMMIQEYTNMKGEMSMNKVSNAINTVYEIVKQEWQNGGKHNINLAIALDQLAPFYRNAAAIYKEERRMYWIEMMDVFFDDGAEKLTAEELEKVLSWMEQNDRDETEETEYKLHCALKDCGLTSKVCDEDEEEEG